MLIFSICISAINEYNEINVVTSLCKATDQDQATGMALRLSRRLFPYKDGWRDHIGMASKPDIFVTQDNIDKINLK